MKRMKKITTLCTLLLLAAAVRTEAQPRLSLSLERCRQMALEQSETLRQADNALRTAELDRRIATANMLPKFEGSATGAYMLPDMDMMGNELRMRGTYMAGITLSQPIYTGGKITTARRLTRIGEEAAAEQLRMTRMDVVAEADNAYWTLMAVESKVAMLEGFAAMLDTLYRQTSAAVEAGMTIANDRLRVEARRSDVAYQLQKVRNGADLCRLSLCRIIGAGAGTQIELTEAAVASIGDAELSADTESRPELRLLRSQVEAGRQQVRLSQADMLPTVGLSVGYTYYGNIQLHSMIDLGGGNYMPYKQEFRDGMGLAMLAVKVPIFHWGESRKRVRKARYELQNAELELQKNSRLLDLEVQQAIRNLQDGRRMIATAEIGLRQADENLRVMQNRYRESMTSLTDLLDAQTQWQQAESNLIEARAQLKIYETAYLRATGNL